MIKQEKSYDDYLKEMEAALVPGGWTWEDFAEWTLDVTAYFIRRNKMLEEQLKIENTGDYEMLILKINKLSQEMTGRI